MDDIIKVEVQYHHTLFPKRPRYIGDGENPFGIVVWQLYEVIEGTKIATDNYNCITVKGAYYEEIEPRTVYQIEAKLVNDKKYGHQYELIYINGHMDLTNVKHQKQFLSQILTQRQIEEFYKVHENPMAVLESGDKEALKKIHGVGDYIADRILDRYYNNLDKAKIYTELNNYELTPAFVHKLIQAYRSPEKIIDMIKNHPYQLCDDLHGVGFITADKYAMQGGISPRSVDRIMAAIKHILEDEAEQGNSYITSAVLMARLYDLLGDKDEILEIYRDNGEIVGNNINAAIQKLKDNNTIILEDNENKAQRRVYLTKYYDLEHEVAFHLMRLANAPNRFNYENWEKVIAEQEEKQGYQFTEEQRNGIKLGLDHNVCFITGAAGCGKSSLVAGILSSLFSYNFAQCALSGRAGARLREITGEEGYTIHRLLEYGKLGFARCVDNPLEQDIIILDELSLVGGEIFLRLLQAIPTGAKLILLGDMGQLESIGCMNLAADIFKSKKIATVELTKIHRQAQKSGIIVASNSIRNFKPALPRNYVGKKTIGELEDMHFDMDIEKSTTRERVMNNFVEYYHSEYVNEDVMNIQVLTPCKARGDACVVTINADIQEYVNPPSPNKQEVTVYVEKKAMILREDDKVMIIKNNYGVMGERIQGVFNGWTGILKKINREDSTASVYIPMIDDTVVYEIKDLVEEVILGYCSTIHKYQGSSAPVIIGVFDYSVPPSMHSKELLYTLWTRAEKQCIMVGQSSAMYAASQKSGIQGKNTFLLELLDEKDWTEEEFDNFEELQQKLIQQRIKREMLEEMNKYDRGIDDNIPFKTLDNEDWWV